LDCELNALRMQLAGAQRKQQQLEHEQLTGAAEIHRLHEQRQSMEVATAAQKQQAEVEKRVLEGHKEAVRQCGRDITRVKAQQELENNDGKRSKQQLAILDKEVEVKSAELDSLSLSLGTLVCLAEEHAQLLDAHTAQHARLQRERSELEMEVGEAQKEVLVLSTSAEQLAAEVLDLKMAVSKGKKRRTKKSKEQSRWSGSVSSRA
jgi:chromosome segregation ATPase